MRATITLVFAVLLVVCGSSTFAGEISGEIHFGGGLQTDSNDLENATYLDFFPSAFVLSEPAPTGDFTGMALTSATFSDFQFSPVLNPTSGVTAPGSIDPLWTAGDFEFRLDSVSIDVQSATTLGLSGTGIVTYVGTDPNAGFDPTAASWVFSAQSNGSQIFFSFSANSATVVGAGAIPEPATLGIVSLGLGLSGLAGYRRRRRQIQAAPASKESA